MATRLEKYAAFKLAFAIAKAEKYDFPSMAAFIDKYMRDEAPVARVGNAKLMAEWGKAQLALVNEFQKLRGDEPLDFPACPDTRKPTYEDKMKAKAQARELKMKQLAEASKQADEQIRATVQGLFAEHPVNNAGDVPSV